MRLDKLTMVKFKLIERRIHNKAKNTSGMIEHFIGVLGIGVGFGRLRPDLINDMRTMLFDIEEDIERNIRKK